MGCDDCGCGHVRGLAARRPARAGEPRRFRTWCARCCSSRHSCSLQSLFRDLGFERRALTIATFGDRDARRSSRRACSSGGGTASSGRCCSSRRSAACSTCTASTRGSRTCSGCSARTRCGRWESCRRGCRSTSIAGNALVKPIMRAEPCRRDPARVLVWTSVVGTRPGLRGCRGRLAHAAAGLAPFCDRGGAVAAVGHGVRHRWTGESGVPQRAHPLGAARDRALARRVLRRRGRRRGPAGAGLGVSAGVDRRRLAASAASSSG